ncbi:hypothetical protein M427DRAFT_147669 [Gonapodya prolifera JEL478]|uniref:Uncharacterized protein n=1 Tax=Gonapodya prolifera (strain JEL478) TaxID=1344416 RepID=A0A139A484_GONPJ|nr:hypothetical protein M427DRAFT_147669 [Gonapodya prolifera JEL478]|eukprot:KXS11612.1 hypothetical protein M427DRAFT_147669 [Gonapodya prolifera JEL478]
MEVPDVHASTPESSPQLPVPDADAQEPAIVDNNNSLRKGSPLRIVARLIDAIRRAWGGGRLSHDLQSMLKDASNWIYASAIITALGRRLEQCRRGDGCKVKGCEFIHPTEQATREKHLKSPELGSKYVEPLLDVLYVQPGLALGFPKAVLLETQERLLLVWTKSPQALEDGVGSARHINYLAEMDLQQVISFILNDSPIRGAGATPFANHLVCRCVRLQFFLAQSSTSEENDLGNAKPTSAGQLCKGGQNCANLKCAGEHNPSTDEADALAAFGLAVKMILQEVHGSVDLTENERSAIVSNAYTALHRATPDDAPLLARSLLAQLSCLVFLSRSRKDLVPSVIGRALRHFYAPSAEVGQEVSRTFSSLADLDEARILRYVVSETSSRNNPRVFARVKIGEQRQVTFRDSFVRFVREKYQGNPPPGVSPRDLATIDGTGVCLGGASQESDGSGGDRSVPPYTSGMALFLFNESIYPENQSSDEIRSRIPLQRRPKVTTAITQREWDEVAANHVRELKELPDVLTALSKPNRDDMMGACAGVRTDLGRLIGRFVEEETRFATRGNGGKVSKWKCARDVSESDEAEALEPPDRKAKQSRRPLVGFREASRHLSRHLRESITPTSSPIKAPTRITYATLSSLLVYLRLSDNALAHTDLALFDPELYLTLSLELCDTVIALERIPCITARTSGRPGEASTFDGWVSKGTLEFQDLVDDSIALKNKILRALPTRAADRKYGTTDLRFVVAPTLSTPVRASAVNSFADSITEEAVVPTGSASDSLADLTEQLGTLGIHN